MSPVPPSPTPAPDPVRDALVDTALGRGRDIDPWWLYLSPQGRIRRATFWRHGVVALTVMEFVVIALLQVAGFEGENPERLTGLMLLWPAIVLTSKRAHDIGWSGWVTLVNLVPVIGQLLAVALVGFKRGQVGTNRFGPDPKR